MKTIDWTRDELVAYILLFAANSDFKEDNKERNIIISKVDMDTFQEIHDEFNNDNDYQGIQKIMTSLRQHNYESEDIDFAVPFMVCFFIFLSKLERLVVILSANSETPNCSLEILSKTMDLASDKNEFEV